MSKYEATKQKRKFSSFFKSLVIELDKDLYGPDNHLVEVRCAAGLHVVYFVCNIIQTKIIFWFYSGTGHLLLRRPTAFR